ncbi:hypothetical protein MVG78_10515 [Roseomonas gilardii subsp. gilardii]|uniref:hypothetical protein n=1 Tax=Roseomonas gilardii TaxID=257708 RepID=UPI001FF806E6|nr:hypothetical protein [Roseomonas gilardii]UPG71051.1 hypothetical protein MVG78_10515 [Roseomonas gilardii subsp. gilardii]
MRARLATWLENTIKKAMAPLEAAETKAAEDSSLRGHLFRLREYLGLVPGGTEREITPELRAKLKGIGVRAGRFALYLPEMLKPKPMSLRAQLWALAAESAVPPLPVGGLVSITPPSNWPAGFAAQMGWVLAGEVMIRLDVAERVAGELGHLTRRAPALLPGDIASRLGVKAEALAPALTALGFRLLNAEPLPEEMFGPPAPLMVAARREDHHRHGRHDHRGRGQPGGQGGRGRQGGERGAQGGNQGANRPAPDTTPEGENPLAAESQDGQPTPGAPGKPRARATRSRATATGRAATAIATSAMARAGRARADRATRNVASGPGTTGPVVTGRAATARGATVPSPTATGGVVSASRGSSRSAASATPAPIRTAPSRPWPS